MLDGEECRVEDDAYGHGSLEEGVVNDPEEDILELQPAPVAEATAATSGAVAILGRFWK